MIGKELKDKNDWEQLTLTETGAWNELEESHYGIPEADVAWVNQWMHSFEVIDVREEHELSGHLGHIEGVTHIPMHEIPEKLESLSLSKPYLFLCKLGGRSLRVAAFLKEQGYDYVASVRGGMADWNENELPVAYDFDE